MRCGHGCRPCLFEYGLRILRSHSSRKVPRFPALCWGLVGLMTTVGTILDCRAEIACGAAPSKLNSCGAAPSKLNAFVPWLMSAVFAHVEGTGWDCSIGTLWLCCKLYRSRTVCKCQLAWAPAAASCLSRQCACLHSQSRTATRLMAQGVCLLCFAMAIFLLCGYGHCAAECASSC